MKDEVLPEDGGQYFSLASCSLAIGLAEDRR